MNLNLFQVLTLSAAALLIAWELVHQRRRGLQFGFWLFRLAVWLAVAAAVADPDMVQKVASAIGIGTGANLVLYIFVFIFLGTSFYFYARTVRLQREITQLTRHIALREATRGTEAGEKTR